MPSWFEINIRFEGNRPLHARKHHISGYLKGLPRGYVAPYLG